MTDAEHTPVLSDGLLVRYLDGEADAEEAARVEGAHPADPAAARLWQLRAASHRFAADVAELPIPPLPDLSVSRRRHRWQPSAAAAALLLVTGVAAALPTTRDAIRNGLVSAFARMGAQPEAASGEPARATISAPVTTPEFLLRVEGLRSPTSLRIVPAQGSDLRVTAPGADLLVLPSGIRIDATSGVLDSLTVAIPAGLARLRIQVDGMERVVDVRDGGFATEIRLIPGGGPR